MIANFIHIYILLFIGFAVGFAYGEIWGAIVGVLFTTSLHFLFEKLIKIVENTFPKFTKEQSSPAYALMFFLSLTGMGVASFLHQ
ncbi:hypothetical protein [Candidatus Uabimicrobium sp. HlEnr_7]|uniref:hypothetical protein n=1 Tax=Candidatus Uabimicrobium helgolandensis TaxID=3095367 RepID=UPI00355759C0